MTVGQLYRLSLCNVRTQANIQYAVCYGYNICGDNSANTRRTKLRR